MFRKTVAALLFVLAASPFTAPFATCNVTTLFGGETLNARAQISVAPVLDSSSAAALCTATRRGWSPRSSDRLVALAPSPDVLTRPVLLILTRAPLAPERVPIVRRPLSSLRI